VTDYAAILTANYEGCLWTLDGDTYDGLTWLSDSPKPSQAELDAAWPAVQQARQDAVAAKETARQSAISKLAALGLTVDEISAAFGLDS
jgi:DNA-binding NarL/FixJ family response regulator